ncbi:MAG: hypothetical protein QW448_09080 [Thermofilaceae archaeon]
MSGAKCIASSDCVVEVQEKKVIVSTWAWTLEIEVEKVKGVKVVRGTAKMEEKTCLSPWLT